jgi:hypothetical protein
MNPRWTLGYDAAFSIASAIDIPYRYGICLASPVIAIAKVIHVIPGSIPIDPSIEKWNHVISGWTFGYSTALHIASTINIEAVIWIINCHSHIEILRICRTYDWRYACHKQYKYGYSYHLK